MAGDNLVGKAIAAAVVPNTPFVTGMLTQTTVFNNEVQKQFLTRLDPLSVLEYFRVRLMPVSQRRFLDRLPQLRRVDS